MCYIVRMISSYMLSEGQWRCRPLFGYLVIPFILFRSGPNALFHFIQWYWFIDFVKLILSLFSFLFIGIILTLSKHFLWSRLIWNWWLQYIFIFTSYFTKGFDDYGLLSIWSSIDFLGTCFISSISLEWDKVTKYSFILANESKVIELE